MRSIANCNNLSMLSVFSLENEIKIGQWNEWRITIRYNVCNTYSSSSRFRAIVLHSGHCHPFSIIPFVLPSEQHRLWYWIKQFVHLMPTLHDLWHFQQNRSWFLPYRRRNRLRRFLKSICSFLRRIILRISPINIHHLERLTTVANALSLQSLIAPHHCRCRYHCR